MGDVFEVLLADQHTVFVDSLASVLRSLGHRVVATVSTRSELTAELRARQPRLCVTAHALADGSVLDDLATLGEISPLTRIVVLSASDDAAVMHRAVGGGAAGFVHASCGITVLVDALARVERDELVIEGTFQRRSAEPTHPPHMERLASYLTQRELECLGLLTRGLDTTAMSRVLGVAPTTVRTHVQAVLTKLGAHSRLEAAALAVRFGLVPEGPAAPSAPRDQPGPAVQPYERASSGPLMRVIAARRAPAIGRAADRDRAS